MKFELHRSIPDVGDATLVMEVYQEDGDEQLICAVYDLEGQIKLRPKAWLSLIRSELTILENEARKVGCVEMRFVGRFKKNMVPGYEDYEARSGLPGLRKVLT